MSAKKTKKNELLEAGSAVMLCKGYHGTGVQEIVDAAGVPKGSFYNYFKSKEDFVIAAMDFVGGLHISDFEHRLLDDSQPPTVRILETFGAMMAYYDQEKNYTQGCFIGNMCQEMADTHAAVAEKAEYLFRRYTSALGHSLREHLASREAEFPYDPDKLAEFIFNSWEGAILRMKSSRNTQPLSAFMDILKNLLHF